MTLRHTIRILSVVSLSLTAAACGRHPRQHHGFSMMMMHNRQGGMQRMHRMHRGMGDPVAQLLEHQAALRLTPAQVNSLISIDEKLIADNTPLRDRLMALRPAMGRGKADSSNPAAHIPQRDSAATIFQQMRENRWRAANAAYGQLNEEQMGMVAHTGGGRPGGFQGGFRGGRRGPGGGMPDGAQGPGRMGKPRGGAGGGGGNPGGPPSGANDQG
jgi:hypothetical protein